MEHWKRFEELATTQLFAVSNKVSPHVFWGWLEEIDREDHPHLRKTVIFFQEGRSAEDIAFFRKMVTEKFSGWDMEIVEGVPLREIAKMIELANEINGENSEMLSV